MTARRTLNALLARRMLAVKDRLERRLDILLAEAGPALAAAKTAAEATPILHAIVDDLVAALDREEVLLLGELQPRRAPSLKH
jgi:hypothetical protein